MAFERCRQDPTDYDLAIRLPGGGFHRYDQALHESRKYWRKEMERSKKGAVRHTVASGFEKELNAPIRIAEDIQQGHLSALFYVERERLRGLGSMATGQLYRMLVRPSDAVSDAARYGFGNVFVDMCGVEGGMPLDYRLHIMPNRADLLLCSQDAASDDPQQPVPAADNGWYREGDLYVRKTNEDMSTQMAKLIQETQIQLPASGLVTLYPYLASLAARLEPV